MLKSKQIKIIEIPKWGEYLRKQWENNFTDHLSIEEKKSIHLHDTYDECGYLWHIFSFEKRDNLSGGEAEEAFNNEDKEDCYIFYQRSDTALIIERANMLTAHELANESDIYVVDRQFKWTYVVTHEKEYCGPYFSRNKKD